MARVLLVHQPVDGGVGRHVADLAGALAGAGHEVITCGPAAPGGGQVAWRHVPLALQRAVSPRAEAGAARALHHIISAVRPHLLHAHSSKAGAIARLVRSLHPRLPVVYTPHGYAFAGYFERELERRAYRLAERALSPLASRILCVCEAEARLARQVGSASRVRVVHNGIAPAPPSLGAHPAMAGLAARGPVICTLTQLRPGKGVETLLEAFADVLAAEPRAQLAVWGDGPELGPLRDHAVSAGVASSVHFLGTTDDPLAVMCGADIFTLPSLAESFPYVILEAMSVARPIVASDVGGVGEALAGGAAGLLVAPSDRRALAGALCGLLSDRRRAQELGRAAHARVTSRFTISLMSGGVTRIYGELTHAFDAVT